MNAVEIEEEISRLAERPFQVAEFPFSFLEAFGNKATTIKRLRSGASNNSDLGGILQHKNIHIKVCPEGEATATLTALKASRATARARAKFTLATDGTEFQAEDLTTGETIVCNYADFPDHFGFFLPLAGITTVKQIRESAVDIKATGRLNRLYVALLKDNPDWGAAGRQHEMNHFMARLIFCFFAEDTDIFGGTDLFTGTIERMSAGDSANTHEVISEIFHAMNSEPGTRRKSDIRRWADAFPHVNGGLFSKSTDVPRFSRIARSYLLHIGNLDWKKINPDIFGSMIQAISDEEERGALGMHYTSVPNILKVLNPLFLDDLREKLKEAGSNARKLLNLRNRMARVRVFDPACGSGNFLVIAYKEMRAIEAEINQRRSESGRSSDIPLTNFRGIELRSFPAEIARLALIIAEYQCDVLHRGQREALAEFLPLDAMNWITCGNALRLDWVDICPPTGTCVKHTANDLFETPLDQAEIDFENEGGETYICGNPPYLGTRGQSQEKKQDLRAAVAEFVDGFKALDFVAGWFVKATNFCTRVDAEFAFVATNSLCQGQQVPTLWPWVFGKDLKIGFAHTSFKWTNLAQHNAGVTVVIIGLTKKKKTHSRLFSLDEDGLEAVRVVPKINPYLVPGPAIFVEARSAPVSELPALDRGSAPTDGGAYLMSDAEKNAALRDNPEIYRGILRAVGANEFSNGLVRWAIKPDLLSENTRSSSAFIRSRMNEVAASRLVSTKKATRAAASRPHAYTEDRYCADARLFVPQLVAEAREYITPGLFESETLVLAPHFQGSATNLASCAIIASRVHMVWISTVCGKLKTDFRYSNTLGWNTFPVPVLTEKNKSDLVTCAEDILLAREAHFPATVAELYDPEKMPEDLRAAHDRNDEVLERIYIGRRFRNDTERLEKLFDMHGILVAPKRVAGWKEENR